MFKLILLTTLVALFGAACSIDKKTSPSKEEFSASATTDEEISNALMTANTQEMSMAKLGKQKTSNPKIKAYSEKMFTAHARNNDQIIAWSKRKERLPEETRSSMKMKFSAEDQIEGLKRLQKDDFDRAYIKTQVDLHQNILEKLDDTLIPNARDIQLRTMLQHTRGMIDNHLKEAKELQKSI